MPFFPDSPFTIAYALILFSALGFSVLYGDRTVRVIALFMFLNWVGTRAVTAWGGEWTAPLAALTDSSCAILIALLGRRIDAYCVTALFGLMLLCYLGLDLGWLEYEQTWAFVDVLAYLQIAILVAGGIHGLRSRKPIPDLADSPIGAADLDHALAVRLSSEASDADDIALARQHRPGISGTR